MLLRHLALSVSLCVTQAAPISSQAIGDTLAIPGLRAPVEILRDAWGIPHIYAENEHDLFFAQGFSAARDRIFQLELWRRRATGTMAEILGRKALDHDIGARLFSFRGDLDEELIHYHPRGAEIVTAFVEGINAFVALTEENPKLLPIEFTMLNIKPGRWTPEVVVSRHNGLFRNAFRELSIAKMVQVLGPEATNALLDFRPAQPNLSPDPAIDLALLDERVLHLYRASRAEIEFGPSDIVPGHRLESAVDGITDFDDSAALRDLHPTGSNNWVLSGEHTFSGSTMMANDPHRDLAVPSLRYWVHLVAPGWNVIGGGEPALPGVAIGHNEYGAWGLTIFEVDQEDLYVYDTNPANSRQYRYRDRWVDMEIVTDSFEVRDEGTVTAELRFTRHGPVVHQDSAHHKAYALRAAWLEVGSAPYLASLRMDQAKTWDEFRAACAYFRTPSENMVWADAAGNIGWQATGITPLRQNHTGLLPVPGDGRFEWSGFLPILDLPHEANPPRGWIATANDENLPPGYTPIVGYEWATPFRISRIAEFLDSGRRLTLMDMQRLQHDELSIPARSLIPLLRGLDFGSSAAAEAADRMAAWDHVLDASAVGATIYVEWERRLRENVRMRLIANEHEAVVGLDDLSLARIVDWLTVPDGRLGPHPTRARDNLVVASLEETVAELSEVLGPDQGGWTYGRIKHVLFEHILSRAVTREVRNQLDVGPLPRGGYEYTVNYTSDTPNQTAGATFRIIVDTGNWDQSVGTSAPGQSGDPESTHYDDLFADWASGRYFPVLFSRATVQSATEAVTVLRPPRP